MTVKSSISLSTDVTNIRKFPLSDPAKNGVSLDTLAQLQTNPSDREINPLKKGTCIKDKNPLIKRARRKYLTENIVLKLVDAGKANPNSDLGKSYWHTWHCARVLHKLPNGKVSAHYCKQKWCTVCNSIRTAQLINDYRPHFEKWDDPWFVTVTRPNVTEQELPNELQVMKRTFTTIKESYNRQARRKKQPILLGLRKTECTYNVGRNTFHPHFHFLFNGKDAAFEFLYQWLERNPTASPYAQDIVKSSGDTLMEMFKYFTKLITTSPDGKRAIYADAMDIIFNAIKGHQVFRSFGFVKGKKVIEGERQITAEDVMEIYTWISELADWANPETGELLSGYIPSQGMKSLVEDRILLRPRNIAKPIR